MKSLTRIILTERESRFLENAYESSVGRIRHDLARASSRLKPLLRYVEEHIFDHGLTVQKWKRSCGIRTKTIEEHFRQVIGCTPHSYIMDRRMEVAASLLLNSDLKVWQIGTLVGYTSLGTFSRAFERWAGERPNSFRRNEDRKQFRCQENKRARNPLLGLRLALIDPYRESRLIRAQPQLGDFMRRSPESADPNANGTNKTCLLVDSFFERDRARVIWTKIEDLPFNEQRAIVRRQVGFETTALFDLLLEKSREAGRKDRQLGVKVAELALASLEACGDSLHEELPNRHAEGWICLSHAQRLALDFAHSEQSGVFAEAQLQIAGRNANPAIAAELSACKAALRWFQRRYDEALELVERSIEEFRELEAPASLARALLLRFNIRRQSWGNCVPVDDLREAARLIDADEHAYLMASCYTHKALAHLDRKELEQARSAVSRAKGFCYKTDYKIGLCVVQWLDGLVQQGQEPREEVAIDCFQNAIKGFDKSGELAYAAVVSLDLAILYKNLGQNSRVVEMASSAIPVLDALKIQRETFAALKLLRQAVEENEITMATLKRLRIAVLRILQDPVARERLLSH